MTDVEDTRLEELEIKLSTVEDKVDQILTALIGSDLSLNVGMVQEIKELKGRILKLENLKNRVIWMTLGAGLAGGLTISKIIEWIQESAK